MAHPSGLPVSLWLAQPAEAVSSLPLQDRYDVVIIGAGIAGACTAHFLAESGLKVAVLESHSIFTGVTGNTTGKLTAQHGLIYHKLIKTFGADKATLYAQANLWAIQHVRQTVDRLAIDCNLEMDSAHIYTTNREDLKEFEKEIQAYEQIGLTGEIVDPLAVSFGTVSAIRMMHQARYHPVKFLRALLKEAQEKGVHVCENTRALNVAEEENECRIETNLGPVRALQVVVATHYPIHDSGWFVAKLAPYRAYAMAFRLNTPVMDGMYITEREPQWSLRKHVDETGEYQIVGGGNHKVGQSTDAMQNYIQLESWARSNLDVDETVYRWSTQDNWTPDGLPYIGLSPHRKRIFVATGFAGWGMSNGVVAGKLLSDLLQGLENDWAATYSPSRMEMAAIRTIVKENLNVASHLVGDRVSRAEYRNLEDLAPGMAGIVQLDDKRVAAYRDENGHLHQLSSACTHMGCQVAWNNAEKSWDCPCHGSRFSYEGEVLHGPATTKLDKYEVKEKVSHGADSKSQ